MKTTPKKKVAKFPRCPECGGNVELCAKSGRTRQYRRGVYIEIPADFKIPTCEQCGEEMMSALISSRLDAILHEQFLTQQATQLRAYVHILKTRHSVTQRQIEDACGVTRSYLSHLLSGKREAGTTLMRLIEVFALFGDTFEHARDGKTLNMEETVRRVFDLRPVAQKYQENVGYTTKHQRAARFVERPALAS
ncbi:MAG: helix-turn-helix domain-containing protein [Myxococcales bacterium]